MWNLSPLGVTLDTSLTCSHQLSLKCFDTKRAPYNLAVLQLGSLLNHRYTSGIYPTSFYSLRRERYYLSSLISLHRYLPDATFVALEECRLLLSLIGNPFLLLCHLQPTLDIRLHRDGLWWFRFAINGTVVVSFCYLITSNVSVAKSW